VEYPKGDPPNPMTWEEITDKFMSLAEPCYGKTAAEKLCALVDRIEEVSDFDAALKSNLGLDLK